MTTLIEAISSTQKPFLWIDDIAYTERLFNLKPSTWLDSSELTAYRRKAAGMLKLGLNLLPLERVLDAWMDAHPSLIEAMRSKKRAVAPIRTLLQDETLRLRIRESATALQAGLSSLPLVLSIPSPRAYLEKAYARAFDLVPEIDDDAVDATAVYLAEFLRTFDAAGAQGVLIEETHAATESDLALYQPLVNVAEHYRWTMGYCCPFPGVAHKELHGFSFVMGTGATEGRLCGVDTPADFWQGGQPPKIPIGSFRYARIPADAAPEAVLERLSLLGGF